jgi:O-antigen/teichoic acid export membrane protein
VTAGVGRPERVTTTEADRPDGASLRGSVVLLGGRVLSLGAGLVTTSLVVRTLSKADFDDFAVALLVASLVQSVLALGFDRTDTRFLALYDERRDPGRVVGTVVTELLVVALTGTVILAALASLSLGGVVYPDVPPVVFLALLCTAPLMASDSLVLNVFAVFAKPTAVFARRYVLDPAMRLTVVVTLLLVGMRVERLAVGYLLAGLVGSSLYGVLLVRLLRRVVAASGAPYRFSWPGRVVFSAAIPLMSAAVMYSATTALPGLALKQLGALGDVAELRAVQPLAVISVLVPTVFGTLFIPRAARLVAREEHGALRRHYWTTAVWVGVLSFPLAAIMIAFARPVTVAYAGQRYADAAVPLAVMSLGFFVNASLGLNSSVLQVAGRLRAVTLPNLVGLLIAGGAAVALIPRWGVSGAAVAVASAVVVPQLLKQWALRAIGIGATQAAAVRMWIASAVLLAGCAALDRLLHPNLLVAVLLAGAAALVLLGLMRHDLRLDEVLPASIQARANRLLRIRNSERADGDGPQSADGERTG